MDENKENKIIDFSKKSNKSEENIQNSIFKGFEYVKLTKDENGNTFKPDILTEYAKKCFYVVTVLKTNGITPALYKYKIPYEALLEFLSNFNSSNEYGKIIDIERYIPEDLA